MTTYRNLNGDSGVVAYETQSQSILVRFRDGSEYNYTYASAGHSVIEQMKNLASAGRGLNSFINRWAKKSYASKSRTGGRSRYW